MAHRAVYASKEELLRYNATRESGEGEEVLKYRGFRFTSFHSTILDSLEADELFEKICELLNEKQGEGYTEGATKRHVNNFALHLPPMVFGHDVMRVEVIGVGENSVSCTDSETVFSSTSTLDLHIGLALSLDAKDALTAWAAQHTRASLVKHPLQVLQVPFAWAHKGTLQAASSSSSTSSLAEGEREFEADIGLGEQEEQKCPVVPETLLIWDWTFSSDYCCTLGQKVKGDVAPSLLQNILRNS